MGIPTEIQEIVDKFKHRGIVGMAGELVFSLDGLALNLDTRDVIGGVLQEWFGEWMITQGYDVSSPENTQAFPDFYINKTLMLESKSFYHGKKPGFDVAAYSSYIESLVTLPQRLDAAYVIFSYEMKSSQIFIRGIWLKNIWEMVGPSPTNILELQVKRGYPTNIRPKNFPTSPNSVFSSRYEFCEHLHRSALRFGDIRGHDENWLSDLQRNYLAKTGVNL
tara:strand:- start:1383 stop:2045 length:663 start_codon:yes stop_codon:yes gene_type:complete